MLYKYINETTIEAQPSRLTIGDVVIFNPSDEVLRDNGYKELINAVATEEEVTNEFTSDCMLMYTLDHPDYPDCIVEYYSKYTITQSENNN